MGYSKHWYLEIGWSRGTIDGVRFEILSERNEFGTEGDEASVELCRDYYLSNAGWLNALG